MVCFLVWHTMHHLNVDISWWRHKGKLGPSKSGALTWHFEATGVREGLGPASPVCWQGALKQLVSVCRTVNALQLRVLYPELLLTQPHHLPSTLPPCSPHGHHEEDSGTARKGWRMKSNCLQRPVSMLCHMSLSFQNWVHSPLLPSALACWED